MLAISTNPKPTIYRNFFGALCSISLLSLISKASKTRRLIRDVMHPPKIIF